MRQKTLILPCPGVLSRLRHPKHFTIQAVFKSKILVTTIITAALFQISLSFCLASTFSAKALSILLSYIQAVLFV